MLTHVHTQVQPVDSFSKVWDSSGTHSRQKVSVWAYKPPSGLLTARNKLFLSLGHYVALGFNDPLSSEHEKQCKARGLSKHLLQALTVRKPSCCPFVSSSV